MTALCYKSSKFNKDGDLLQGWQFDDNKSDNNKNKIWLLLKRWN